VRLVKEISKPVEGCPFLQYLEWVPRAMEREHL